jgi:hypothetical protein
MGGGLSLWVYWVDVVGGQTPSHMAHLEEFCCCCAGVAFAGQEWCLQEGENLPLQLRAGEGSCPPSRKQSLD